MDVERATVAEATAALPLTLPATPHCDTTVRVLKLGRWVPLV